MLLPVQECMWPHTHYINSATAARRAELAADQAVAARLPELPQRLGSQPAAQPPAARQLPSGRSLSALRCAIRAAVQDKPLCDCLRVRCAEATPCLIATLLTVGAG